MTYRTDRPYVDTQSLRNTGTYIYETVATLEYSGKQPSRTAIAAVVNLDEEELDRVLDELASRGLLTVSSTAGESVYEPARRDWSTRPDLAAGQALS